MPNSVRRKTRNSVFSKSRQVYSQVDWRYSQLNLTQTRRDCKLRQIDWPFIRIDITDQKSKMDQEVGVDVFARLRDGLVRITVLQGGLWRAPCSIQSYVCLACSLKPACKTDRSPTGRDLFGATRG